MSGFGFKRGGDNMPEVKVGSKTVHFPYTNKGKAAAARLAKAQQVRKVMGGYKA